MQGLKLLYVCTRGHWSSNELHWLDQALGTIRRRITLCHSLWCPGGLMRQVYFWACAAAVIAHNLCSVNYAGAPRHCYMDEEIIPQGKKRNSFVVGALLARFIIRSCWGYIGFTPSGRPAVCPSVCPSICPSVRPSRIPCLLCSTYSSGWIHFILYILASNFRRCVMCNVACKISKIEFLVIFKISDFDLVLFWLGIWCESLVWVIMGRRGYLRMQAF